MPERHSPKPLFGERDVQQTAPGDHTPGAVSFPSPPPQIATAPVTAPSALKLPVQSVSTAVAPVPKAQALFADKDHPLFQQSIATARASFAEAFRRDGIAIQNQIKQLLGSLDVATVSTWGAALLTDQSAVTTQSAVIVKQHSQLDVGSSIDAALSLGAPKTGLLAKLLPRDVTGEVLRHKSRLLVAQTQLASIMVTCTQLSDRVREIGNKLTVRLASIAAVRDTAIGADSAVCTALQQRSTLLQSAITQNQLMVAHLQQIMNHAATTSPQIEQLLTVTLPSIELAAASR